MDLLIQGVSAPCLTDSTVVGAQCQSWVSRRLCSAGGAAALCSTHHHAVLPPAFLQLDGSSSTMPRRSISIPYPSIQSPSQRGSIHSLYAFCPPHTKSLFWLLCSTHCSLNTCPFPALLSPSPSKLTPKSLPLFFSPSKLTPKSLPLFIRPMPPSLLSPGQSVYCLHSTEEHLLRCFASLA